MLQNLTHYRWRIFGFLQFQGRKKSQQGNVNSARKYMSINIKHNGKIPFTSEEMTVMGNDALTIKRTFSLKSTTQKPFLCKCSAFLFWSSLKKERAYGCQWCRSARGNELPRGKVNANSARAREGSELFWDVSLSAPALYFIPKKVCKLWGADAHSRDQPTRQAPRWGGEDERVCAPRSCHVPSLDHGQAGLQGLRHSSPRSWPFRHVESRDRCRQPPPCLTPSNTPRLSHAAGLNLWVQAACLFSRSNA